VAKQSFRVFSVGSAADEKRCKLGADYENQLSCIAITNELSLLGSEAITPALQPLADGLS
jgi:hypothetical protein